MVTAKNPILSGFYPDPSICRVGEDFYLVNSSFAYFPGIPIFHSKDLAHWEQIGNVLDREKQISLRGCRFSGGIYAPTIRYHEGMFYIVTTNVTGGGNFYVTAQNPEGPWSDPYYLGDDAAGIDPSLFFDDDGTCYYIGTRWDEKTQEYNGDNEIYIQELDLKQHKLIGESTAVWKGAMRHAIWPEGPHLYKKDGYYYLMHAEGGTEFHHSVMIARSRNLSGPYEGNRCNPILTHRHLGEAYPVKNVGHGDLVEAQDGSWYMVMLGSRPCENHTSLGRETFLANVSWEDEWPVVNPGVGHLTDIVEISLKEYPTEAEADTVYFTETMLGKEFLTLRNPSADFYSLKANPGFLRLYMKKETLQEAASPSYIGIRQRSQNYEISTEVTVKSQKATQRAGLAVVQSDENHMRFEVFTRNKKQYANVTKHVEDKESQLGEVELTDGEVELIITARGQKASFEISQKDTRKMAAENVDMCFLSTEAAGGFVGNTIGMYVSSNGEDSSNYADFKQIKKNFNL